MAMTKSDKFILYSAGAIALCGLFSMLFGRILFDNTNDTIMGGFILITGFIGMLIFIEIKRLEIEKKKIQQ